MTRARRPFPAAPSAAIPRIHLGGGLYTTGGVNLSNCTIVGNSNGGLTANGAASLTNCTITGNTGDGGLSLEGVRTNSTIVDCTISGNATSIRGGGLYIQFGTATLTDTIVAGNKLYSSPSDIYGLASGTHNLIGIGGSGGLANDVNGNMVGVSNPLLGPLGNYGGPTQTIPLLLGSPAVGAGAIVSGITTDQRGLFRGNLVDIGAFQASLDVESTAGTVDTQQASLSLAGAVSLANQYDGLQIAFDPAVFAAPETIGLQAPRSS